MKSEEEINCENCKYEFEGYCKFHKQNVMKDWGCLEGEPK